MANYYGYGRSNYFRVKDPDLFREFIGEYASELGVEEGGEDSVCLVHRGETGDLPTYYTMPDPEGGWGDEVEINMLKMISEHLVDEPNNIFIWQAVGHEKLRYLNGYSEAVNAKGEEVFVSLEQIYQLCEEKLGGQPTKAQY